jgi:hypothetical protein
MNAKAFSEEICPSVSILRRSRIGIFFLQRNTICFALRVLRINACRRRVQVSSDTVLSGCFYAMKIE